MSEQVSRAKGGFSYSKIFVIGSGFFALTLIWTVYNAYMPLLLAEFISQSWLRGAIMGLDNLLAVILIPIIGAWSDKVDTKLGQRLPFILVGMPIAALFFILLPYGTIALWVLLAIDIVFLLAMTIYRAPVISLMPDHTPSDKRSTANGVINLMGGVGAIIALFALAPLVDINMNYPFIIGGIMLFLSFVLLYFVVDRNPPYAEKNNQENEEVQAVQSIQGFSQIFLKRFRGHFFVLVAIFLYFIGFAGVEAQFTTYATNHLGYTGGAAGLTLGFFSLAFVLFAVPAGLLGSKFGKMSIMLVGLILLPSIFFFIPFIETEGLLRTMLFAGGLAWALINVQAYPLVADMGGKTRIGFFTGLYYLFSMSSAIVAPALLGLCMDIFGYPALFFGATASFIIAFYFLKVGSRRISEARMQEQQSSQLTV